MKNKMDMWRLEKIENLAYRLYIKDWCKERNFPYVFVRLCERMNREYKGQMYVCMAEFLDYEFYDKGYMEYLLRHHKSDLAWIRKFVW